MILVFFSVEIIVDLAHQLVVEHKLPNILISEFNATLSGHETQNDA